MKRSSTVRVFMAALLSASIFSRGGASNAFAQSVVKSEGAHSTKVAASAEEAKPLTTGSTAPDVTLTTVEGKPFKLGGALKVRPTIIIFYRGGWCPYCNLHLADLRNIEGDLKGLGYQLLAISMDRPEELRKTMDKHHLTYTLLSDSDANAVRAFGVAYKVDDKTVDQYKGFNVDLEKASGRDHHILPVPSVFIIGTDRVIRFVYSNPDIRVRLAATEVLKAARVAKGVSPSTATK